MSDERPKKEQNHQEKKIEALEKMKRPAPPRNVFKPRGSPPHKQLTKEDKEYNAAIDRQVQFWQEQVDKTQGMEGKARDAFAQENAKGKVKGKAKDRFNRANEHER